MPFSASGRVFSNKATQITLSAGLPFAVRVPNAETLKALRDAEAGRVTRYSSPAEMFEDMGI